MTARYKGLGVSHSGNPSQCLGNVTFSGGVQRCQAPTLERPKSRSPKLQLVDNWKTHEQSSTSHHKLDSNLRLYQNHGSWEGIPLPLTAPADAEETNWEHGREMDTAPTLGNPSSSTTAHLHYLATRKASSR